MNTHVTENSATDVLVTAMYQYNLSLVEMISVPCYASEAIMLIVNSINIEA